MASTDVYWATTGYESTNKKQCTYILFSTQHHHFHIAFQTWALNLDFNIFFLCSNSQNHDFLVYCHCGKFCASDFGSDVSNTHNRQCQVTVAYGVWLNIGSWTYNLWNQDERNNVKGLKSVQLKQNVTII